MDVASLSTSMSQYQTQVDHATKVSSMVKDQIEQTGEMALQLIDSAAPVSAPDPSSPLGQTIDIRV